VGASAPRYRPTKGHPVEIQIMGEHLLDVLRARDVSVTGIGVLVPHRFEGFNLDSDVELLISLPRQRPFLTRGRIVHSTDRGGESAFFGVSLTNLSAEHRGILQAYLDSGLAERTERAGE
jgi:hypothetical protein